MNRVSTIFFRAWRVQLSILKLVTNQLKKVHSSSTEPAFNDCSNNKCYKPVKILNIVERLNKLYYKYYKLYGES